MPDDLDKQQQLQKVQEQMIEQQQVLDYRPRECNPDVSVPLPLNQLVIENMLRLPGLSADTLLQAIKGNTFDHVSAIYNLLVDRLEPTMPNLHSIQSIPGDYLPDGAHQLEKFGETEAETEEKSGLYLPSGTSYHTTRRHTVGPGDAVHQSPSSYPYHHMSGYQTLRPLPVLQCNMDPQVLPHTNLPLNLPLVQHQPPQNFQIKDQHLLKPPPVMGATGGFGRRASDGGANLHIFHQQHSSNINNDEDNGWSQPGSREQLQSLQSGSSGLVPCAQSLNVAVSTATGDGSNNNSGNNSGSSDRRRRSGLSTVMQRPGRSSRWGLAEKSYCINLTAHSMIREGKMLKYILIFLFSELHRINDVAGYLIPCVCVAIYVRVRVTEVDNN
ncbi:Serine/threonine-protein kinase QSK [Acromyrmex echinatior]|uniref:Serine/threonine-protein kinase QSK n=1 Tax=Acromyrmex echinatior TaxID=103372 RepID=F4WU25_ACREC|nr:Serine/threonine-protein kinase QSK [Acromyrmex echinatior]